jgi:hypothetical protein
LLRQYPHVRELFLQPELKGQSIFLLTGGDVDAATLTCTVRHQDRADVPFEQQYEDANTAIIDEKDISLVIGNEVPDNAR